MKLGWLQSHTGWKKNPVPIFVRQDRLQSHTGWEKKNLASSGDWTRASVLAGKHTNPHALKVSMRCVGDFMMFINISVLWLLITLCKYVIWHSTDFYSACLTKVSVLMLQELSICCNHGLYMCYFYQMTSCWRLCYSVNGENILQKYQDFLSDWHVWKLELSMCQAMPLLYVPNCHRTCFCFQHIWKTFRKFRISTCHLVIFQLFQLWIFLASSLGVCTWIQFASL